jgi:hypothetical protein
VRGRGRAVRENGTSPADAGVAGALMTMAPPRRRGVNVAAMRKLFPLGIIGLLLFEAVNVYFVMPLPGSQRMRSIDAAYAVYQWRWVARVLLGLLALGGMSAAWRAGGWQRRMVPPALLVVGVASA